MSRDITPFGLRMQPELKKQVEEAARASGRSLNAEIVLRLKSTFAGQVQTDQQPADLAARVEELERRIEDMQQQIDQLKPRTAGRS